MYVTEAGYEIIAPSPLIGEGRRQLYRTIELAGRTCYKSEDKITDDSAAAFVSSIVKMGHEAMLEHASVSVRFTMDRGLSHEIVRHRMAAFAQESTRWCNYSKGKFENSCTFIDPYDLIRLEQERKLGSVEWTDAEEEKATQKTRKIMEEWGEACSEAEKHYMRMLELGASPEVARSVLPNSLKTDVIVTANLREWRHIFKMRAVTTYGRPHPQMQMLMHNLLIDFAKAMPEVFADILENEAEEEKS